MMTHNDVISAHSSITPYDAMNLDDFIRVTFGRVMTLDDVISLSLFFFFSLRTVQIRVAVDLLLAVMNCTRAVARSTSHQLPI